MFVLILVFYFFFFKQKTAYEMRISDWSSDVCSSDLPHLQFLRLAVLLVEDGEGCDPLGHRRDLPGRGARRIGRPGCWSRRWTWSRWGRGFRRGGTPSQKPNPSWRRQTAASPHCVAGSPGSADGAASIGVPAVPPAAPSVALTPPFPFLPIPPDRLIKYPIMLS